MPGKDRYTLLSKAVRIANTADLSYLQRLKSLAKFLCSSYACTSATIYLIDENNRSLTKLVSTATSRASSDCHITLGEGVAGLCAAKRHQVCLPPAALHPQEPRRGTEKQFCAFPIGDSRMVCGVLMFGLSATDPPSGTELEPLEDILVVIGGIIQRIGISSGSQRRIVNLTMLSELGALLNRSVPPASLIPVILDTCHQQSDSCCTVIRLVGSEGMLPLQQHRISHAMRRHQETLLGIEELCSAKVRLSGVPLLISDLISEDELPPSYVCVPLKFENRIFGTMTFFGKRGQAGTWQNFTEEERELFESMAVLISNAITGATNYQQAVRLSRENDQKLKELSLLYRLSNTMLSTIRLNKLMHLILSALTSGSNPLFERSMLFLINERAGVMQGMLGVTRESPTGLATPLVDVESALTSRWDISEEEMQRQQQSEFSTQVRTSRLELSKVKNMSSRAVLEKRLVYVADTGREKRVDREFVKRFGISSFAAMPLLAKDKVVGVVVVDNPCSNKIISQDDLRFLELFTNQAGMAIENSLLYNRIEDANRKLRDAQERLLHGERLATIGEMAAGIAHELKSPLISIGGFARRLQRKFPKASEEGGYVATIVGEVNRLEKMLTDILSFSRKSTICYSVCTMQEIIDEALSVVALGLEESRITVSRKFPPKVLSFLGDCQQLKQVFINIFTNAQEAMQGPGELKIAASPARLAGRDAIMVKVADTGGGIPLESLGNIFHPFFTTKESGTGLGLPIANRIVTNHSGKLQVNNYQGVGVEFVVIIPLEPPPPSQGG